MKSGFSLVEIMIVLVLTGVIASLAFSFVFTSVEMIKVEKRLIAFDSTINQAINRSYVDLTELPEIQNKDYSYIENKNWLNRYILPYLSYISAEKCENSEQNTVCVKLQNGDLFKFEIDENGGNIIYFPDGKLVSEKDKKVKLPRKTFAFQFNKTIEDRDEETIINKNYFEPYSIGWDGTEDDLYNNANYGCKKGQKGVLFCTKLIQMNNWKIPKNYPW